LFYDSAVPPSQAPNGAARAISPEMDLLLCCARSRLAAPDAERLKALVRPDLDWARVLSLADAHALTPLAFRHLHAFSTRVPTLWLERLHQASRASTVRSLYLAAELGRVLSAFRLQSILAIPYKGPVLAAQAYGDVALRQYDDLDILVPHRFMPAAHETLTSLGYRARFPWPHSAEVSSSRIPGEYTYRAENGQTLVELHTERTLRHFPLPPNLEEFARRLVAVPLAGRVIATFRVEDALTFLSVHGAKDFWERLSWIADIAELTRTSAGVNWSEALEVARSLKAERMLLVGLALARDILEAPLPGMVTERIAGDAATVALGREFGSRLLSGALSRSAIARARFRFHLLERPTDGVLYAWRLATAPAEDEWSSAGRNSWSARMQALVRPLRLMRKHGVSGPAPGAGPA